MTNTVVHGLPRWSLAVPPLALVVLVLSWGRDLGPTFSGAQLAFAGVVSLVMYGVFVFVFVQTVRHRDYFLPVEPSPAAAGTVGADEPEAAGDEVRVDGDEEDETHAVASSGKVALSSLGLFVFLAVSP